MHRTLTLVSALLIACAVPLSGCGGGELSCTDPGAICLLAGTGEAGYNGDGLPAEETTFNLPTAARVGPDGLVYIMDFNNFRLRCLTESGTVQPVAGNGEHAYALEGENALNTPLENPIDFDFDAEGRVVFVSLHDPRVLRVEPDGTVSVVAGTGEVGDEGDGGPATEALFRELAGITVGPDGSIYVSDDDAHRVRVIRPDGIVDTVAGNGEEGFSGDGVPASETALDHPEGLTVDPDGNLIIADTLNHRIRRVDKTTGIIETLAGTGEGGFSGDLGPATLAELKWPSGVAIAPDGRLYIADTWNNRIRIVDDRGVITTIAGTGEKGYSGDGGAGITAMLKRPTYIEVTGSTLLIADTQNQIVRTLSL